MRGKQPKETEAERVPLCPQSLAWSMEPTRDTKLFVTFTPSFCEAI